MIDTPDGSPDSHDVSPDVFVLRVDCSVASTRQEVLARLRHADGDGLHTRYWRFETLDGGAVLAERHGGKVLVHRAACREMLGEEV